MPGSHSSKSNRERQRPNTRERSDPITGAKRPIPGSVSDPISAATPFIIIALQLGLLLLAIDLYRIEARAGLPELKYLIFGGFVVHAWLPLKWRRPFFFTLTLAAMIVMFGWVNAAWLAGVALAMIGLCHLPIPFWSRVLLVIITGVGLAVFRFVWFITEWPEVIIVILGSMFMFRLAIYLYDLRGEKEPATLWERLCYFFMLPNVVFPFYPIVDYITYRRTYYNENPYTIYQKGVLWMMRGCVHLLLYRAVYYYMSPSMADVRDLGGVVLFIVSSYLLYLRISGLFHLTVGILCLFGFNLPETHRLYFLASGFNDFWRRINIYWKNFMMKLFFYPVYMRTRRWGDTPALVLSTLLVFFFTWLLHSYQWFWLQGRFPIRTVDGVFWGVLGVLVAINAVYEARRSRKPFAKKSGGSWDAGAAVRLSLRTVATFVFMAVIWSFWSSESAGEWVAVIRQAGNSSLQEFGVLALGIVGLFCGILCWRFLEDRGYRVILDERRASFGRIAWFTSLGLVVIYAIGQPRVAGMLGGKAEAVLASLQVDRMSIRDEQIQERGYYEQLLDSRVYMAALWEMGNKRPADWEGLVPAGVARETNDLLGEELFPSIETVFKRAPLTTNRWGLRDGEYELEKPANTLRIALFGKSYEMGWGVKNEGIFEQIAEDSLNVVYSDRNYEIINFSVGGYTTIQYAVLAEEKLAAFKPDVLIVAAHAGEGSRTMTSLLRLYRRGTPLPPELQRFIDLAGLKPDMPFSEMKRNLEPYEQEIVELGYERLLSVCRDRGIVPVWLFVPRTMGHLRGPEGGIENEEEYRRWVRVAEEMGFELRWSLAGVFDRFEDPGDIQLAEWDTHPNDAGHRLLGDAFYDALVEYLEATE